MSVRLKVEHGQDQGKTWGLKQPGVYVIGRDPGNAIRVLDMKVSKGHCEIEVNGADGVWLRDLKSTHGTQLNGQPVTRDTSLKAGDEIRLGFTALRLLSDGPSDGVATPNRPAGQTAAPAAPSGLEATFTGTPPTGAPASGGPGKPAGAAPHSATQPTANGGPGKPTAPAGGNGGGRPSGVTPAPPPPRELPPDELVGKALGGYQVLKKIGQGGMGSVYIAEQVSLKREVALKVLSEKFVADSAFVDQFVNEARAAGQLNHPNVVQVYDVGHVDGRYFFSMEFVHGGSIEDKIKAKPAEWRAALNWFLDAANALIFAGKRGILHRDVKPDNLMLSEDGSAKLCDLGLAKKSESSDLLAQGIIGTPHFISPEAIRRKPDIDTRTDLYSLGCTFFRILTGVNPYAAPTVKDILLGHLNKPVPRVTEKKPDVPKELSDVVFKLMQKDPAERYASADELYRALDKIRIQHGLAEHGIKPTSRKPLIIALLVVILGAGGALAWLATRPDKPSGPTPEEIKKAKDLEERNKALRAEAERNERDLFIQGKNSERLTLVAEMAAGQIQDTWREVKWQALIERFKTLREAVLGHEKFGTHADAEALAETIDADVKGIQDDLATLAKVESELQQKKAAFQRELGESLDGRLSQVRRLLDPPEGGGVPRWWEAARLLAREAMKAFVEQSKGKEIQLGGRTWALMKEEDRLKAIQDRFPGEDWPGQKLSTEILEVRAAQVHGDQMKRATDLAQPPTLESLAKAAEALEAYRESLPEPEPTDQGDVAKLLRTHRGAAFTKAQELRRELRQQTERIAAEDRQDFFKILHMLREPGSGALWSHVFSTLDGDPKLLVDGMRRPEYQALARQLLDDARAFAGLFTDLVASFAAKQWTDLEIEGSDGKKLKILEVGPEAFVCPAKVRIGYVDLGHKRLLERVFLPGGQPRFAFSDANLRGLAVMAELAGDGEQAQKHWMAYKAKVGATDPAQEQIVMKRLARLPLEMEAARLWLEMKEHHEAIARMEQELAALGLPTPKPPISPAAREKIQRARNELQDHILAAGARLAELANREDLASTFWGASTLPSPHARAAYAGEELPGPAPAAPPAVPPAAPAPNGAPAPNAPPDVPPKAPPNGAGDGPGNAPGK